jgi:hypothetical protein
MELIVSNTHLHPVWLKVHGITPQAANSPTLPFSAPAHLTPAIAAMVGASRLGRPHNRVVRASR